MALLARLREIRGHVIWIARPVVIVEMATHASRVRDVVVIVDVAVCTLPWRHRVQSGKRKRRLRVIKLRRLPCRRIVASLATL